MRKQFTVITIILVVAVLLAGCGTFLKSDQSNPPQRVLSVTGSGKTLLAPDIAYINIGVHTENVDVTTALSDNNKQAQAVTESLKGFGVDAKDVQTSSFNVYPQQQYGTQGEMLGTKFVVDNTVYVTVRDLTQVGKILDAVVKSGANNINGIQFDVADKTAAMSKARDAAVADARQQAEELAAASGATLGSIQSISIVSSTPYYADNKGVGGSMMSASVPVSAGQMAISADVSITYELK